MAGASSNPVQNVVNQGGLGQLNQSMPDKDIESLFQQYAMLTAGQNLTQDQINQFAAVNQQLVNLINTATTPDEMNRLMALAKQALPSYANPQQVLNHIVSGQGPTGTSGANTTIPNTLSGPTSTSISEVQNAHKTGTQNTQQTVTNYVDMPTPAEFLDNFQNAFGMHIQGMLSSGAISQDVANFANQNQSMFLGDYMRAQIADVLKGNPLFRVVGLNPDEKLIGSRAGYGTSSNINDNSSEGFNLNRSENTAGGTNDSLGNGLTTLFANEGAGVPTIGALTGGGGSGSSTLNLQDQTNMTDAEKQNLATQEAIIQRNKLGVVANLAPLDFLKDGASAQRLNFIYAGQKGTQEREFQTSTGTSNDQAVRRVGG